MNLIRLSGDQRRGIIAVLAVTRVPLLLLLAAVIFYLAAAASVWTTRNYGFDDARLMTVYIDRFDTEGSSPDLGGALQAIRVALTDGSTRAALITQDDAGVTLGVYDPDHVWFGLPFSTADYQADKRRVAMRHGSVASALRGESAQLFHAAAVLPDYGDQGAPPRVDLVYPIFAAESLEGQLLIDGIDSANLDQLTTALGAAGYEATASGSPSFTREIVGSPIVLVIWVILFLTWLSVTVSWGVQASALKDRLQKEAMVGGSAARVALRQLFLPLTGWLLACAFAASTAALVLLLVPSLVLPASLWTAWIVALLLDLTIALLVFWLRCRRLARLERS